MKRVLIKGYSIDRIQGLFLYDIHFGKYSSHYTSYKICYLKKVFCKDFLIVKYCYKCKLQISKIFT